jgi:hypothetical protein
MIAAGQAFDDVIAARLTARYDAQWGKEASWTADDFIPIVYAELGGPAAPER